MSKEMWHTDYEKKWDECKEAGMSDVLADEIATAYAADYMGRAIDAAESMKDSQNDR